MPFLQSFSPAGGLHAGPPEHAVSAGETATAAEHLRLRQALSLIAWQANTGEGTDMAGAFVDGRPRHGSVAGRALWSIFSMV